jgi:hypothetical protein
MTFHIRQTSCFLIVHTCHSKNQNRLTKYDVAVISGTRGGNDAQWDFGKPTNVGKFPVDWNSEK